MDNNCTIYAEMHLSFDNDFDVYSITERLGIQPTNCKLRTETLVSPLTNKYNEGFWTLKTEEKEEWDSKVVLDELMEKIIDKLPEIKKICDENAGTVTFDIVPCFHNNSKPALYFERDFLDVVNYLDGTIQIDLYVE